MSKPERSLARLWIALAAVALLAVAVIIVVAGSQTLPDGPQSIVWDRTSCAECRMAVSEKPYAAQLQTADGQVLDFDDPGCLFRFVEGEKPEVHAMWFRDVREDRWIRGSEVAFIESGPSPMGFDLGAVPAGSAGSIGLEQARAQVLAARGCCDHAGD